MTTDIAIERARAALARSDWDEVYEGYAAADQASLTGADLEAYANAAWWRSTLRESMDIRQRAYAAFAAEGDDAGAGGAAARLAVEHFIRGEFAVGSGFLMRARRHAEALPEGVEHGLLAVIESNVARATGDPDQALARSRDATRIGRAAGDPRPGRGGDRTSRGWC